MGKSFYLRYPTSISWTRYQYLDKYTVSRSSQPDLVLVQSEVRLPLSLDILDSSLIDNSGLLQRQVVLFTGQGKGEESHDFIFTRVEDYSN